MTMQHVSDVHEHPLVVHSLVTPKPVGSIGTFLRTAGLPILLVFSLTAAFVTQFNDTPASLATSGDMDEPAPQPETLANMVDVDVAGEQIARSVGTNSADDTATGPSLLSELLGETPPSLSGLLGEDDGGSTELDVSMIDDQDEDEVEDEVAAAPVADEEDTEAAAEESAAVSDAAVSPTTTQPATDRATTGRGATNGSITATYGSSGNGAPAATTTTTTTTTAAPAPTTTAAPAPTGAAVPYTISRPPCGDLNAATTRTAPFTGLSASIPSDLPAVVVKVSNNTSTSRANLIGLNHADIVFEEPVEARATRFFSVYHSSLPENVGPVRSGRTTDIELASNLSNPIFGYSGSNRGIAQQLNFASSLGFITPYPNNDSSPYVRDPRYVSPENLFVSPAGLGACGSANPTPIFSYGANNSGTARSVSSASFDARSSFRFDWNGSKFVRSQTGSAHVTREGARLEADNLIVLFTPFSQSEVDPLSVDARTVGSGEAWIMRDGQVTVGRYSRGSNPAPYTFTDGNGTAINLKAGKTWVVLAPAGSASFN